MKMSYAVKLARLEKLAGKDSCPACSLVYWDMWPGLTRRGQRPDLSSFVIRTCNMCGARRVFSLAPYDESLRPMLRLFFGAQPEDTFTDARAWAARMWILWFAKAVRARVESREFFLLGNELMPRIGPHHEPLLLEFERIDGPLVDVRALLDLESHMTRSRVYSRLSAHYRENPFPEFSARMKAVKSPDYRRLGKDEQFSIYVSPKMMSVLESEAGFWLKCAEAEQIAIGDTQPYTALALAKCEWIALWTVAHARQRYDEEEAERRLKEEHERRGREQAAHIPVVNNDFYTRSPAHDPKAQPVVVPNKMHTGTLASQQRSSAPDTRVGQYHVYPSQTPHYETQLDRELAQLWPGLQKRRRPSTR